MQRLSLNLHFDISFFCSLMLIYSQMEHNLQHAATVICLIV